MPADVTTLIDAVAAELADLYPDIPVYKSKRPAADGKPPLGGWAPGYKAPAFVVSANDPEPIDDFGTFETVSVRSRVLVEYVKPAEQKVSDDQTGPSTVVEDPDVRDKRQAVRRRLYKPRIGAVPEIMDVRNVTKPAFQVAGGGQMVANGQEFDFELVEDRAE